MRFSAVVLVAVFVAVASVPSWAEASGKKTIYVVEKMTCGACLATISKGVALVAPGAQVTGDPVRGVVVVRHDAAISAAAIGGAITKSGYPARVMASVDAKPGEKVSPLPGGDASGSCCFGAERPACGAATGESWKALYQAVKARFSPELP